MGADARRLYLLGRASSQFPSRSRWRSFLTTGASESKTPEAMLMRNAHRLHHHETGKWALPWSPW